MTTAERTPFCSRKRAQDVSFEEKKTTRREVSHVGSVLERRGNGEGKSGSRSINTKRWSSTHVESLEESELGGIGGRGRVESVDLLDNDVGVTDEDSLENERGRKVSQFSSIG